MSYFDGPQKGYGWAAGFFLVSDENCTRATIDVPADHALAVTRDNGRKVVPAGAVIPANDGTAKGLLYEDVEVTTGNMPGSLVTRGAVYAGRLPAALASAAATALKGITVKTEPTVTRPDDT